MERKRLKVSGRKIEANQQNALASTGPRTEEGKIVAARNGLKHGLDSRAVVLPTERPEDWEEHRDSVLGSLAPTDYVERELAEQVAFNLWRLRRVARYEAESARFTYNNANDLALRVDPSLLTIIGPEDLQRLIDLPGRNTSRKVLKVEAHYTRCLGRALAQLRELRRERRRDVMCLAALATAARNSNANPRVKPVEVIVSTPAREGARMLPRPTNARPDHV